MRHILLGFDASLCFEKPPSSIKSSNMGVLNRSDLPRLRDAAKPEGHFCSRLRLATPLQPRCNPAATRLHEVCRTAWIQSGWPRVGDDPAPVLPVIFHQIFALGL
jgi:hypothetical protein